MSTCPRCGTNNVLMLRNEMDDFLVCRECGFDELEGYDDLAPGDRISKKGRQPYRTGGKYRARKI